jgi:hypothetical protein
MASPIRLPSGKWRVRWLDHAGRRQSATYDTWRDADHGLRLHQIAADAVRRGEKQAPAPQKAFSDLATRWLDQRAPQKRSGNHDKSILRRHLLPAFGHLRLAEVTFERIEACKAERVHVARIIHDSFCCKLAFLASCVCAARCGALAPRQPHRFASLRCSGRVRDSLRKPSFRDEVS